jgi:predicted outer membrane repeat protein
MVIANSRVSNNSAKQGGGILAFGTSLVTITNSSVQNNLASGIGGGVCMYGHADLLVAGGNISRNTAQLGGGLGALGNATVVLT